MSIKIPHTAPFLNVGDDVVIRWVNTQPQQGKIVAIRKYSVRVLCEDGVIRPVSPEIIEKAA